MKATEERIRAAEMKSAEILKKKMSFFTFCLSSIMIPEMKALVIAATNTEDLPINNKKADL
jgi:hypothetical protein